MSAKPPANPPYGLPPDVWSAIVALTCCAEGPQSRYRTLSDSLDPMVPVPLSWIVWLRDCSKSLDRLMEYGKDATWSTDYCTYPKARGGVA